MPRSAVLTSDIENEVRLGRRRKLVCGQEDVSTMEDGFPADPEIEREDHRRSYIGLMTGGNKVIVCIVVWS